MSGVYKAIAAVQGELAKVGISKSRKNSQGAGYMFRGIDDVYSALSPLLSTHGLVVIPRVVEREQVERMSKAGGVLIYTTVKVDFDFVAVEDGSVHTASTYGEAMDSGDKSTNKAMSAAYKYAAFMTFAIPTEGDNDADASTHSIQPRSQARQAPPPLKGPIKTRAELRTACSEFVRELHACGDEDQLNIFLAENSALTEQVEDEHELFWNGDGMDFLGLRKEIEAARERVREYVDMPDIPNTFVAG